MNILIPSKECKDDLRRIFKKLRKSKHKSSKNYYEHALYFMHEIHTRHHINKSIEKGEAVPMNFNIMKSKTNARKIRMIISALIREGYVTTDNRYKVGETSRTYAINYDKTGSQTWSKHRLNDNKLVSNISTQITQINKMEKQLEKGYQIGLYWNKELDLNIRQAKRHLPKLYAKSKDVGSSAEHSLVNWRAQSESKAFMWVKDSFGNRLHTRLTSLKSDFRKYLSIDGQKLGQVDIANSQPLFLYLLMKNDSRINKEELDRFGDLVLNGKFYESLAEALDIEYNKENKSKIKEDIFQVWYGSIKTDNEALTDAYIAFKSLFPSILKYVDFLKRDYYKDCCQLMQKTESDFIFKSVTRIDKELGYHKVPLLTIHDSIVTTIDNLDKVVKLLEDSFYKQYGVVPKLSGEVF